MAVSVESDREDDALLQDDLLDENEFKFMLLTLLPISVVFPRQLSVLL